MLAHVTDSKSTTQPTVKYLPRACSECDCEPHTRRDRLFRRAQSPALCTQLLMGAVMANAKTQYTELTEGRISGQMTLSRLMFGGLGPSVKTPHDSTDFLERRTAEEHCTYLPRKMKFMVRHSKQRTTPQFSGSTNQSPKRDCLAWKEGRKKG